MVAREHEHARCRLPRETAHGFHIGIRRLQVERDGLEQREHTEHQRQQTPHDPGRVVPVTARGDAGARRRDTLDAGNVAEIDGLIFRGRRERAHAVTDRRQRVVANQVEAAQRDGRVGGLFDQQLRAGDGDDIAGDDHAGAAHGDAIDAHAALGRGIEQPAARDRAQAGRGRSFGRCRVIMVGPHEATRRIEHHARAKSRLFLLGTQDDGRVV
jgi:hypothetical protein